MKGMTLGLLLVAALWTWCEPANAADVLRFDMATADSPLEPRFTRVTCEDAYSARNGFGWVGSGYESVLTEPPTEPQAKWVYQEKDHYASLVNDMTRDEVKNTGDMTFRVNLPDGKYRVILYLGDLRQPLGSVQVYANGELIRKNVHSKRWISRQGGENSYGNSFPVRFTVDVSGGILDIAVKGDDSDYRAWVEADSKKPPMESYLAGKGGSKYNRDLERYQQGLPLDPRSDLGHPFVYNAVQALEIYPVPAGEPAAPITEEVQKHFDGAIRAYAALPDPKARLMGLLRVLGNADYDVRGGDEKLIAMIAPLVEELGAARPDDPDTVEAKMTFDIFQNAVHMIENRSRMGNPYHACMTAATQLEKLQPDDPLYYKGMVYRARALYMIDPHRWAQPSGTGKKVLEDVEKVYPNNRYVRLYVHGDWKETEEWKLNDYRKDVGDAPEWAVAVREAYNFVLDLAEWWIEYKQQPDGSLGGGWGDDVELVGFFGMCANVSEHTSDIVMEGALRLIRNAWIMSEIDTEAGFFGGVADAQHTAEFTGDTLPVIMTLDYGNPVWLERAMKTGKLLRDLWTGTNDHGYRSFRSNYLGATMVEGGKMAASSSICLRAIEPLHSLYEYNQNPVLEELLVELADGWVDAAMETGKDKPKGIIPSTFSFPEVEMGGPDSPTWYDTGDMPWRQFFIWPQYRGYVVKLLTLAYEVTGDEKYLEAFELAAAYLESLEGYEPDREAPKGSPEWMAANLRNHQGISYVQRMSSKAEVNVSEAQADRERILSQCETLREGMKARWPIVTTESLATDRVHVPGMGSPIFIMTTAGGSFGTAAHITYAETGRDFAAYVPLAEPHALKVVIYLFQNEAREVGLRPWVLESGAKYEVRVGPDADGDDVMDQVEETKAVTMEVKGQRITAQIPGRRAYIVEIEQVESGMGAKLLPDLAVTDDDIEYKPQFGILNVRVHNVGADAAEKALVSVYDGAPSEGGTEIGTAWVYHLPPPNNFDPQTLKVGVHWSPSEPEHEIFVAVDPNGEITEVSKDNNTAKKRIAPGETEGE